MNPRNRPDPIAAEIDAHRARTEARLSSLLERAQSPATLDHIKRIIFNETDARPFGEYVGDIVALFDIEQGGVAIDDLLPVLQDAWNYFPHRQHDNRCPAERVLRSTPSLAPRSLRAQADGRS